MLTVRYARVDPGESAAEWSRVNASLFAAIGALACILIGAAAMGFPRASLEGRWFTVSYIEGVEVDMPSADRGDCQAIAAADGSMCVFGSAMAL